MLLLLQKCGELKETAQKKQILVFEDEAIFRRQWKRAAGNRNIQTFENWNDFHSNHIDKVDWKKLDFVVTDYYLTNGETGIDIVDKIRAMGWKGEIYLSSNIAELPKHVRSLFAGIFGKDPKTILAKIDSLKLQTNNT